MALAPCTRGQSGRRRSCRPHCCAQSMQTHRSTLLLQYPLQAPTRKACMLLQRQGRCCRTARSRRTDGSLLLDRDTLLCGCMEGASHACILSPHMLSTHLPVLPQQLLHVLAVGHHRRAAVAAGVEAAGGAGQGPLLATRHRHSGPDIIIVRWSTGMLLWIVHRRAALGTQQQDACQETCGAPSNRSQHTPKAV